MTLLSGTSFAQQRESALAESNNRRATETYLELVLNVVGTNLNYGKSNSAYADYKQSILGAQAGVSFQAGITPRFSVISEFYFLMKGGALKASNPSTDLHSNIRLYTVELPVLARAHFGNFHVNAGPYLTYNLLGTQKLENSKTDLRFGNSGETFKRWETGLQMGGGYSFRTKKKRVRLDVRYNYGLTNISNSQEIYNRSLIISLRLSAPWKTNPLGIK